MAEKIKRVERNGFRYYQVTDDGIIIGTYPSVTSVLGATSDQTGLDGWRNRIGHAKAEIIGRDAANRGTVMHKLCELYLNLPASMKPADRLEETLAMAKLDDEIEGFDNRAKIVGGMMFYNFIRANSFDIIKRVIAQESFLWTPRNGGYAGTVDNLSELLDLSKAVVDFKTARKAKDEKWIRDYKLQVSAYAVAIYDRLGIKVDTCRIWISNEASITPQYFELDRQDIKTYYGEFRERLTDFHRLHPIVLQ